MAFILENEVPIELLEFTASSAAVCRSAGETAAKKTTKPADDARRPCATETGENTEEETKG